MMTVEAFYGRGGYLGATGKPFSGQKRCLAAETSLQRQALLSTRAAHQTEKASREAVSSDSSHAVALQVEPGKCSGCGSTFQRDTPEAPGYVLPHLELAAGGTGKKVTDADASLPAAAAVAAGAVADAHVGNCETYQVAPEVSQMAAELAATSPQTDALAVEKALIALALLNPHTTEATQEMQQPTAEFPAKHTSLRHLPGLSGKPSASSEELSPGLLFADGAAVQATHATEEAFSPLASAYASCTLPARRQSESVQDWGQLSGETAREMQDAKASHCIWVSVVLCAAGAGAEVARASEAAALTAALRTKRCIFVLVVDALTLELPTEVLRCIDSPNPLFIAVNKSDVLPARPLRLKGKGPRARVQDAVLASLTSAFGCLGSKRRRLSAAPVGGRVHFVSSKSGEGIESLFKEVFAEAARRNRSVYLIGAANSGKSSICNFLLRRWGAKGRAKVRDAAVEMHACGWSCINRRFICIDLQTDRQRVTPCKRASAQRERPPFLGPSSCHVLVLSHAKHGQLCSPTRCFSALPNPQATGTASTCREPPSPEASAPRMEAQRSLGKTAGLFCRQKAKCAHARTSRNPARGASHSPSEALAAFCCAP
ncbi:uncharacterized protein LOC34620131 [Cyclospora cayetanensis]|uniref:Uncharacterized protein LOC34620131 n=1 Tax=Cyclospora cayetanensis TaxID=88456 RepID=A0A6P6RW17_9EIME|nr:uncharacterized protein LOC34620131 [Cyclospora cayetanensis]